MIEKAYEKYKKKYGNRAQLIKACEELAELQKAICKYLNKQGNTESIIEEIADVENMTAQMKIMFGCHIGVEQYKRVKINKMLKDA